MFANLFNEFYGKCFYPIFRGFLAWAGAQTTKQQNPRWVQGPSGLLPAAGQKGCFRATFAQGNIFYVYSLQDPQKR
jgi:hypothetical protein